jgi:hypothetical protein
MESDQDSNHGFRTYGECSGGREPTITATQRIVRIREAAGTVLAGSREVASECRALLDLDGRVNRNPYGMMAAAAGTGYILGGGLLSSLTARTVSLGLRLGLRLATSPLIQRGVLGFVEAASEHAEEPGAPCQNSHCAKESNQGSSYDEPENSEAHR